MLLLIHLLILYFRTRVEYVILGKLKNTGDDDAEGDKYEIEKIDVHPERTDIVGLHDIAIITLKNNISFNEVQFSLVQVVY